MKVTQKLISYALAKEKNNPNKAKFFYHLQVPHMEGYIIKPFKKNLWQ
jgi:hypothetical protein